MDGPKRFLAGLDHFELRRDPVDHMLDKVLPDDPSPVHAVTPEGAGLLGSRRPIADQTIVRDPQFLEGSYYRDSLCGRSIKVVLGIDFRDSDPDACPRCVEALKRGATEPPKGCSIAERQLAEYELADRLAAEHAAAFGELHDDEGELDR